MNVVNNDELIIMGVVRSAFGIKGWVKIQTDTEYADSLLNYPIWWLGRDGGTWAEYGLQDGHAQSKQLVVKLMGVDDRDAAERLRSQAVAILRHQLPEPEKDEYYWADLIGLTVVNQQGQTLGVVKQLLANGAHEILVVKNHDMEHLIPFIDQYILQVALGQVRVDWQPDYCR